MWFLFFCLSLSKHQVCAGRHRRRTNTNYNMKLAEALAIRKDTQIRIEQLRSRLLSNVRIQEGDDPSEDPNELMSELDACLRQLQTFIFRINKTNMHTQDGGKTLTELMAEKDVLVLRISCLRDVFAKASEAQERYSRTEIKVITTIDVKGLARKIDTYSKALRELDIRIQGLNFSTELEE